MLGFVRHESTCLILPSCGWWGSWFSQQNSPNQSEVEWVLLLSWKWAPDEKNKSPCGIPAPLHSQRCDRWNYVLSFSSCAQPTWNSMCVTSQVPCLVVCPHRLMGRGSFRRTYPVKRYFVFRMDERSGHVILAPMPSTRQTGSFYTRLGKWLGSLQQVQNSPDCHKILPLANS